jgi:enamidase
MSVAETRQARRFVAYWAEEGATWIKFYTNISREAMGAAIDEAHKRGMRATGHLCSVTFREAVDLNIDDLAHGGMTASDFIPGKEPDKCRRIRWWRRTRGSRATVRSRRPSSRT